MTTWVSIGVSVNSKEQLTKTDLRTLMDLADKVDLADNAVVTTAYDGTLVRLTGALHRE